MIAKFADHIDGSQDMIVVIAKPPSVPDEVSDGSPNADISTSEQVPGPKG